MLVSALFSGIIYQVMTMEINRFEKTRRLKIIDQLEHNFVPQGPKRFQALLEDPDLINETKTRILFSLLVLNSGIIVIGGFAGYFLAGRTLKPIQKMTDEQNRFISDASHEIKTPLTSLKTAFEVFLRSDKKPISEAIEIIADSIHEVDKLQILSESLLQLAQFENVSSKGQQKKLKINSLIKTALKKVQYLAKAKGIKIKKNIEDFSLKIDETSVVDLLVIILDNSIKYSPKNSEIEIKSTSNGAITIKDNGVGIAPTDLPHIFDRFYRADKSRSSDSKNGYGLGLSIAQKIANSQNIGVSVESKIDKGTTFKLTFHTLKG